MKEEEGGGRESGGQIGERRIEDEGRGREDGQGMKDGYTHNLLKSTVTTAAFNFPSPRSEAKGRVPLHFRRNN